MRNRGNENTYDFLATQRRRDTSPTEVNPTPSGLEFAAILAARATLDFPNTGAQTSADLTITVPGAALGDVVDLGVPNGSVNANSCFTAWVSAVNTVSVRFNNYSAGAINPASGSFTVAVYKFK
jgi:hypothetical protein